VTNWLLGMPFGFVIVSVTRPGGKPVSERSHVEPSGPEFEGRTLTFALEGGGGGGGGGGFVRGAAVGSVGGVVGGAKVGGSGAVLPGAAVPARVDAVAEDRGPVVGVVSGEAAASQLTSVRARTAIARKRPFMVSSYEWDPVPARGTFA
jgi:hypothetical protein